MNEAFIHSETGSSTITVISWKEYKIDVFSAPLNIPFVIEGKGDGVQNHFPYTVRQNYMNEDKLESIVYGIFYDKQLAIDFAKLVRSKRL